MDDTNMDDTNSRAPARLLDAVAADGVPDDADLWPRVARAAAARRRRARLLAVAGASALVAAMLVAPAAAGAFRTAFQEVQFAGLLLVPRWPPPTPTPLMLATGERVELPAARPVPSGGGQAIRTGGQSLAEVQGLVSFPVCAPTWLPPGVAVIGGTAFPPDSAIVVFRPTDGREQAGGGIQQRRGRQGGGVVVPVEHARQVRVAGQPAVYARGSMDREGNWHTERDSAILSWEANGITYIAQYSGLGLDETQLARIAESCAPVGGTR
jgi:hypothetical protein